MHGAFNTSLNAHHTLRMTAKDVYALVHAGICNGAESSLPWKLLRAYLESCASIVQAVVWLPLLLPPLLSRPNPLSDAVRSRNPSKSTLAHYTVAAAVSHKQDSIIRVGAGLIQFVHESHSRLATEVTHHRNVFLPIFARVFDQNPSWLEDYKEVPNPIVCVFSLVVTYSYTISFTWFLSAYILLRLTEKTHA